MVQQDKRLINVSWYIIAYCVIAHAYTKPRRVQIKFSNDIQKIISLVLSSETSCQKRCQKHKCKLTPLKIAFY